VCLAAEKAVGSALATAAALVGGAFSRLT
jgi:hypothetical protein